MYPSAALALAVGGDDVLDALDAPIAVLDCDGRVVSVNDAWVRFGVSGGVPEGFDWRGIDYLAVCTGEFSTIGDGIRDVIDGRAPTFVAEYPCHSPTRERWFRVQAAPLGDGAIVQHADITGEYERVSRWLSRTEVAVIELSPDLSASFVNDSWRRLSGPDEWTRPIHPADAHMLLDLAHRCARDRQRFTCGVRVAHRWVRFSGHAELDPDGAVATIVLVGVDISTHSAAIAQTAAAEERQRLATEIHDTVIQHLYGTGMQLQRALGDGAPDATVVSDAIDRLDRAIADLRSLNHSDRRSIGPLPDAIDTVLDDAATALGYDPIATVHLHPALVPHSVAEHLLAVLSEALSNVARHARAQTCDVQITARHHWLVLTVTDNGTGMPNKPGRASGTRNIERRAAALGGQAIWSPAPLGGTVLTWRVPLTTE